MLLSNLSAFAHLGLKLASLDVVELLQPGFNLHLDVNMPWNKF
jgi:hypothetical protein